MARERICMGKCREILRHILDLELSYELTEQSLQVSHGQVCRTLAKVRERGLGWAEVAPLSDEELEALLYGPRSASAPTAPLPHGPTVEVERRRPGVTLLLLHQEYRAQHPDGLGYSQFCDHYSRFQKKRPLLMRLSYPAGDRMLVDYLGKKPFYLDPQTGEKIECELFVAVLGASNLTYVEATRTQRRDDFLRSHLRACAYFGCVACLWTPDNLKSAVSRACPYEPTLQRDYGACVLPARPRKPATEPRWKSACRLRSAGSWRGCATSALASESREMGRTADGSAQSISLNSRSLSTVCVRPCLRSVSRNSSTDLGGFLSVLRWFIAACTTAAGWRSKRSKMKSSG